MQSRTCVYFLVGLMAMVMTLLPGCDSSDDPVTPPPPTIAGPTNLRAFSASETSVGLGWTASTDESSTNVLNPAYTIRVKDSAGTNVLQTLTAVKGQSSITVSGLTEGTVYRFVVRTNVASGAVTNDSVSVRWAPAKRREGEGTSATPIQVFETASSFPSGLDVFNATQNGPVTFSISGPNNSLVDLYVATDAGSNDLLIRSASLSSVIGTPKTTFFSTVSHNADNLNDPQVAPPDASTFSTLALRVSGEATGATTGKIFWGRTQENNYFRILVERDGASLVFFSSPNRCLRVKISYQSVPGVIYARPTTGGARLNSGE